MSGPDHEMNAEKLTELLSLKDEKITELEAEVEKAHGMVKNRENKLRKRMAKIAELRNTGTVAQQKDQIREQGQYIESLKAARAEDGEAISEFLSQLNHIEAHCSDYVDDISISHQAMCGICEIIGMDWRGNNR